MIEPVDVQVAIVMATVNVGAVAYVVSAMIRTSPRRMRKRLLGQTLSLQEGPSISVRDLATLDEKGVLPLFYRSLPLLEMCLLALPVTSVVGLGYVTYVLVVNLQGNLLPKAQFVHALIVTLLWLAVQGALVVYLERVRLNVEDLR